AQAGFGAGPKPTAVALADLNGDGKPDIIVANDYGNYASVLLGNGNGSFQAQQTFAAGSAPDAVALADFNGDGRPDVVVANNGSSSGGSVNVLLNQAIGGTSNAIFVSNLATTHFGVNAPTGIVAGQPFTVTVTALTASNAADPTYTRAVHITSS